MMENVHVLKVQRDRRARHVREPSEGSVRQIRPDSDETETDLDGGADESCAHVIISRENRAPPICFSSFGRKKRIYLSDYLKITYERVSVVQLYNSRCFYTSLIPRSIQRNNTLFSPYIVSRYRSIAIMRVLLPRFNTSGKKLYVT